MEKIPQFSSVAVRAICLQMLSFCGDPMSKYSPENLVIASSQQMSAFLSLSRSPKNCGKFLDKYFAFGKAAGW